MLVRVSSVGVLADVAECLCVTLVHCGDRAWMFCPCYLLTNRGQEVVRNVMTVSRYSRGVGVLVLWSRDRCHPVFC